jgi:hypothetical protein
MSLDCRRRKHSDCLKALDKSELSGGGGGLLLLCFGCFDSPFFSAAMLSVLARFDGAIDYYRLRGTWGVGLKVFLWKEGGMHRCCIV